MAARGTSPAPTRCDGARDRQGPTAGQTLLITGASSGIGAATARAAVKAGWQVALLARSRDALEKLAAELDDAALALPCDITERDQLSEAVAKTVERFGGLDAVYADAGKGSSSPGIEQGDPDDWHAMIHLNVLAVLTTAHATLPHLRKTRAISSPARRPGAIT